MQNTHSKKRPDAKCIAGDDDDDDDDDDDNNNRIVL
jgi:hypothetical protein